MAANASFSRNVIGVMTGTSIDALDAAMVSITGSDDSLRATFLKHVSTPLWPLSEPLRRAAEQEPMRAGELAQLAWDFGMLHADVLEPLVAEFGLPDCVAVHGQTVFHQPPYSWQLINPAPIAARFNCPVVYDLRQADLARGGQGAPITPAADWILFRDVTRSRAIVNLGGFCNMSILPAESHPEAKANICGFDVCACNQVLDAVARIALQMPFDDGGRAAHAGTIHGQAEGTLYGILHAQRTSGRSLGTGDEAMQWITTHRGVMHGNDLAATAVAAIARCIFEAVTAHDVDEIIVAGGGVRNMALLTLLEGMVQRPIRPSDALGIPAEAREAVAIAVLGATANGHATFTPPVIPSSTP